MFGLFHSHVLGERVSFSSKIVDGFKTTFKPNKQAGEAGLGKSHASVSTGEGDEMAGHHRTDPNRATREIGSIKLLMGTLIAIGDERFVTFLLFCIV